MKYKIFLIYLYFLYIILEKSNCKDIFGEECENNSNDFINNYVNSYSSPNLSPFNDYNFKFKSYSKFYPQEQYETINPGEVQSILLFKESVFMFNINSLNYNTENDLIIYFYPLDCQIQITGEFANEGKEITFGRISNYENNAFYTIIEKNKLNESYIVLNTLINLKDENNNNRTYHLIINSVEYTSNTKLTIIEKEPALLTFNSKTIDNINLTYNLNKNENSTNPISISFFIKERVKFMVKVYNNKNKLYQKTIGYLDRILIDTKLIPETSPYIIITLEKYEEKDAVMIVKVIENYESPIYFQKNILNIGFIPSSVSYQYYYMEIFEGEYGEIILNNKRYNGRLFSQLIPKKKENETEIFNNIEFYPKEEKDEYLKYNEYSQKITFDSEQTNICTDGCYLLITYCSIYFNQEKRKILGTDFTLLSRIFDQEEEFRSQIVNIPLNEYILGSFESSSVKIHYYSFYIPKKTEKITLEININYIGVFIKRGIKKMNIINVSPLEKQYLGKFIYDLVPQYFKLESFEDEYITFGFSNYLQIDKSHYYFRILLRQSTKNDYIIYPLDSNKANICTATKIKKENNFYSCFFFIDNLYKDLYNDLFIYAYGSEHVKYRTWIPGKNEDDYYSINLNELNYKNITSKEENIYFNIDKSFYNDSNFILISIESKKVDNLTVLLNFYDNINFFPPIQIYSYQFIYLYDNEILSFDFSKISQKLYRILINSTYGNGEIAFEPSSNFLNQYNTLITGNRPLSYDITSELNNISIFNNKENNRNDTNELLFNIKIVYELENSTYEELYLDNVYNKMTKTFPIRFCLRDIKNQGADVNFYFYNENKEDLIIKGYIIKYDLMKITSEKTSLPIEYGGKFDGRFDNRTDQGLIILEREENNSISDFYYLIEIDNQNQQKTNITMEIYASSKDSFPFSIPLNRYISGSFDLKKGQTQKQRYYINDAQNSSRNDYIIEFSSNYKHLDLNFSENITLDGRIDVAGTTKFFIYINASKENLVYFEVIINTTIPENMDNYCEFANYIIIYYQEKRDISYYNISLQGQISKNRKNITIMNKYFSELEGYNITCIFNIYERDRILKDELIKTIVPINSKSEFTETDNFEVPPPNITLDLNGKKINKNYTGTVFVKLQKNISLEQIYYYSLSFDIIEEEEEKNGEEEEEEEKEDNKKDIIIISIAIVVLILIIIFIFRYRKVIKRNQDLEKKVHDISFADENTSSKNDDDNNIVTFV